MRKPRFPMVLIGDLASIPEAFKIITTNRGLPTRDAITTSNLLPEAIRSLPCFLDKLTGIWRYDLGVPIDIPDESLVFGTHMWLPVDLLFDVLLCANQRLPSEQFANYLLRLADPLKHEDLITEFAPILRLSLNVSTTYEVEGYGEGGTKIDWLLSPPENVPILIDVKNRTKDLIEQFQKDDYSSDEIMPAPTHDTALLFRSLERKFRPNNIENIFQGAWIRTLIKQEEKELKESFSKLDRTRVHFAILGDWKDDAYILCDNSMIRENLLALFNLRESKRFVFLRS
jgi:hypothetical protein